MILDADSLLKTMDKIDGVLCANLASKRRAYDRVIRVGKEPHVSLSNDIDRAEYIRAQHRLARDTVAEMITKNGGAE